MTRPDMQRNRMKLGWLGKLCLIVRLLVTNWGDEVPRQATNNNGRGGGGARAEGSSVGVLCIHDR